MKEVSVTNQNSVEVNEGSPLHNDAIISEKKPLELSIDKGSSSEQGKTQNSNIDLGESNNTGVSTNTDHKNSEKESVNSRETHEQTQKTPDWYKIACRLRQQNQQLKQKIVALEEVQIESAQKLATERMRSQSTHLLIEQQTQELNNAQTQMGNILNELEIAYVEIQRQQGLIEGLTTQLQSSQQQSAKLERECALLKDDYHQQTQKLIAKEQQSQDLQARLLRQQRYTLQFKSILDQYVTTISNKDELKQQIQSSMSSVSLIAPQVEPIQSWSMSNNIDNNKVNSLKTILSADKQQDIIKNSHDDRTENEKVTGMNTDKENEINNLDNVSSTVEKKTKEQQLTQELIQELRFSSKLPSSMVKPLNPKKKNSSLKIVELPRI